MIEKVLFAGVLLKTELIASKELTVKNNLYSSDKFIGRLKENVSICLTILNSSVSWSLDFDHSKGTSICFLLKKTIQYSFQFSKSFSYIFLLIFKKLFVEVFIWNYFSQVWFPFSLS